VSNANSILNYVVVENRTFFESRNVVFRKLPSVFLLSCAQIFIVINFLTWE